MLKDVYTFSDLQDWRAIASELDPPIRLSVLGDPVAHSASPPMHNAALEKCGIAARYARIHVKAEELPDALDLLGTNGFIGANVTIPHKSAVLPLMHDMDGQARKIGAVNTVLIDEGKRIGFNTDGPGIVRAIRSEFSVDLRDLRVLVLGAGGGAGRAIAVQCAMENCQRLVLANRTLKKAQELALELAPLFKTSRLAGPVETISAVAWERVRSEIANIDLVINATPIGMKRTDASPLPSAWLAPHLLVYDTIYTAPRTRLMLAADEAGARSANGLSMLLHQGALSFEIWFNRPAPIEAMRAALLAHVGQGQV
jgi:shikimate dehydrogenase